MLAFQCGGWAWPRSELVPTVFLSTLAHDREGISFEGLTRNCPLAPRQLVASGHSSVVSFPSFGIKFLRTKNPNQRERNEAAAHTGTA